MYNDKKRPKFLNPLEIRLPVGGVVSILHRISGVALILLTPFILYLLDQSLESEDGYHFTIQTLGSPFSRIVAIAGVWLFVHHLLAGVRHLFLDLDIGIGREAARFSAWTVLMFGLLAGVAGTAWLW
jgi:succinate dehydrogenase / fumarate reductase cytochrome b subunit